MTDVLVGKIFFRRASGLAAARLARTGVTPNQVTLISLLLAFAGSAFFVLGEWRFLIIGAVIWVASEFLDFVDGDLARAKGICSVSGWLCDAIGDTLKKPMLIASLALGYFLLNNSVLALLLALLAVTNIYIIEVLRSYREIALKKAEHQYKVEGVTVGMLDTAVMLVFFAALANQVLPALLLLALAPIIVWAKLILDVLKTARKLKAEKAFK